ncbi:hypothetical protein RCG17_01815 [Neobacillus sp. PS3-12]|uniref:hypothetical protein n=1 Tax=Neobacillus sp. PS3-12 TaxID=3070677 RepID=UPI0027E1D30E|nr:hypothetical protein [Neobacillus sp. PS3-12]WML53460.1 hypothetical protein RCG17_01815 [Neobacillus sp. PS3-12]
MELDMYLLSSLPKIDGLDYEEVKFVNACLNELEEQQKELYEKVRPYILYFEQFGITWIGLEQEIGYLENASQIHNWFVENLHNGFDRNGFSVEVTKDDLDNLYIDCLDELIRRFPEPGDVIPPRPRCFWGYVCTDFYYDKIQETVKVLENLLKNFNFETHYLIYHYSR